ncbi:hypothetical protein A5653_14725 [Mycobacterium colombiense]|nr:hypothetical protein A5653_14725 [Mycobacterium colombiense]
MAAITRPPAGVLLAAKRLVADGLTNRAMADRDDRPPSQVLDECRKVGGEQLGAVDLGRPDYLLWLRLSTRTHR